MPDFGTFTPKCTLVRKFGHVVTISDFRTAITDFKTNFSLLSAAEAMAEDYYEEKNAINPTGSVLGTFAVSSERRGDNPDDDVYDGFTALLTAINNELMEEMFEEGSTAVADSDSIKLKTSFKVKLTNGDTATVTFTDKKITFSGYNIDATGTAFTTWADTQTIFSTDPDA